MEDWNTTAVFNVIVSNLTAGESCTMYKFSGLMPNHTLPQVCMAGSYPAEVPLACCTLFFTCIASPL
jgi:hypothetical protein